MRTARTTSTMARTAASSSHCSTMSRRLRSLAFISLLVSAGAFMAPTPRLTRAATARSSNVAALQSFGDLKGIAEFFRPKTKDDLAPVKPKYGTVIIDPDYRVGALFLAVGGLLDTVPYLQLLPGPFLTLLGVLFLVQATRIRFMFDEEAIELLNKGDQAGEFRSSGENIVVGGANRWNTNTIVNYDFFPKGWIDGPVGPILVYFKETQTDPSTWNDGPGARANDPELIAAGKAVAGQVHFFPAICNAQQIRTEFERRGCRKINA